MTVEREREVEKKMAELRAELAALRHEHATPVTQEYRFRTVDGERSLAELFGRMDDLLVIHNMGSGCPYCTAYADGINGVLHHLERRTAVVLLSNDEPDAQKKFAAARGWRFDLVSASGTSFSDDFGFEPKPRDFWPGVIAFRKHGDSIHLAAKTFFDPGDDLCVVWPLFTLLEEGAADWTPTNSTSKEKIAV